MCTELLPPGGYPTAVNKYIIIIIIIIIITFVVDELGLKQAIIQALRFIPNSNQRSLHNANVI
jgi:hypothetical protein